VQVSNQQHPAPLQRFRSDHQRVVAQVGMADAEDFDAQSR
jgi:hypothetical protein